MYDVTTQRKMWATGWIPQWRLISWVLGLEVSDGSWGKVKQSFKSDLDKPVSFSSQQHSSGGRSTWLVHPQPAALWRSTAPTYTGTDRWNLTGMQSSQVSHFELTSLIGTWGPDFWIPMFWILRIFLDPNWQFFGRFFCCLPVVLGWYFCLVDCFSSFFVPGFNGTDPLGIVVGQGLWSLPVMPIITSFQLSTVPKINVVSVSYVTKNLPSRELTSYPTLASRNIIFKGALGWNMLVTRKGTPEGKPSEKLPQRKPTIVIKHVFPMSPKKPPAIEQCSKPWLVVWYRGCDPTQLYGDYDKPI